MQGSVVFVSFTKKCPSLSSHKNADGVGNAVVVEGDAEGYTVGGVDGYTEGYFDGDDEGGGELISQVRF